ncbi:MAG TPA: hypothetical protein VGO93_07330 [Candidatus Xenobia bacterium]|jgi:hypothetical protein
MLRKLILGLALLMLGRTPSCASPVITGAVYSQFCSNCALGDACCVVGGRIYFCQGTFKGDIFSSDIAFPISFEPVAGGHTFTCQFGVDFTGALCVATAGCYTFHVNARDSALFDICGHEVIGQPVVCGTFGACPVACVCCGPSGTIHLTPGRHPFELGYLNGFGNGGVALGLPAGVTFASAAPELTPPGAAVPALLLGCGLLVLIDRRPGGGSPEPGP